MPDISVSAYLPDHVVPITFGGDTLAGAGAMQLTDGNGTNLTSVTDLASGSATGYSITSGGVLTPSGNGSLAAENGKRIRLNSAQGYVDVVLTIEANTYRAGTGELAAIVALGSAALDGKTIKGLAGADLCGTSAGDTVVISNTITLASGLTITSDDVDNPAYIRRLQLACDGTVTLDQVEVRDSYVPATDYADISWMIGITDNATGRTGLILTKSDIHSVDAAADYVQSSYVSGTAAAHTNGVASNTVTLTNSPDLSGVPTDGTAYARIGSSNYKITGKDDTAKTITVGPGTANISAGSPVNYNIVNTPQFLRGVNGGTTTNNPDIEISHCHFYDYYRAITGEYRSLDIKQNMFDNGYADNLSLAVDGAETAWSVADNVFKGALCSATDALDPHMDCVQINLGPMTVQNTVPYSVVGNRIWPQGANSESQAIFVENYPVGKPGVVVDIRHNQIMTNAVHGITVEDMAAGSVIKWNTVVFDMDDPGPTGYTPAISVIDEFSAGTVENNASHAFTLDTLTAAAATNNHTFSAKTNAGISAVLAGISYSASDHANLAAFTAAMQAGSGEALDTASPKIGAGVYYTYDNTAAPTGSKSGLGAGLASEP